MNEYVDLPMMPGYVSIKEAAKLLDLSVKRVYEFVTEGRLPAVRAADVIMIPLEDVKAFKRGASGRSRTSIPRWRVSAGDNTQFMTSITVQVRTGQHAALPKKLEEIRQSGEHLFPGTIARYITLSEKVPDHVAIFLVWRGTVMPGEATRETALQTFRAALADVLDWDTAQYDTSKVLMHT